MSEFVEYLHEAFQAFGEIEAKRMFGGHGIYHQGLMFALVADDMLYLKADTENIASFTEIGLEPFQYNKKDKVVKLSFYQAPEEIFDDADEAATWARRSYEAAKRAKKK